MPKDKHITSSLLSLIFSFVRCHSFSSLRIHSAACGHEYTPSLPHSQPVAFIRFLALPPDGYRLSRIPASRPLDRLGAANPCLTRRATISKRSVNRTRTPTSYLKYISSHDLYDFCFLIRPSRNSRQHAFPSFTSTACHGQCSITVRQCLSISAWC